MVLYNELVITPEADFSTKFYWFLTVERGYAIPKIDHGIIHLVLFVNKNLCNIQGVPGIEQHIGFTYHDLPHIKTILEPGRNFEDLILGHAIGIENCSEGIPGPDGISNHFEVIQHISIFFNEYRRSFYFLFDVILYIGAASCNEQ